MNRPLRKPLSDLISSLARKSRRAKRAQAEPSRFIFEGLEPRMLLSADPLTAAVAAGSDMVLRMSEDKQRLELVERLEEQEQLLHSFDLAAARDAGSIMIQGSEDDDSLSFDANLLDADLSGLLINFHGGDGNDTLNLANSQGLVINFVGGDGDDRIQGLEAGTEWTVTGTGEGRAEYLDNEVLSASWLSFSGISDIDVAWYREEGDIAPEDDGFVHRLSATVDGMNWALYDERSLALGGIAFEGIDVLVGRHSQTLDYSDYATSVAVDLGTGDASGFKQVSGFGHVIGTNGDDILIGDASATLGVTLDGRNGDNLIVGGGGDDLLKAGAGQSTLVSIGGNDTFALSDSLGDDFSPEEAELTYVVERAAGNITLTSDGTQAQVVTQVGSVAFTHQPVEIVLAAAGNEQTLSAAGYALGGVTFQARDSASNTTMQGSQQSDRFILGAGGGTVHAGGGSENLIEAQADANMTLSDAQLAVSGWSLWQLENVQLARLVGGESDNVLDARGFTGQVRLEGVAGNNTLYAGSGGAILIGGSGDDELYGGAGDDVLFGNRGNNLLDGGGGNNTAIATTSHSLRLFDAGDD
ncbi:MAG: LEPR-XLL domain-containing protein, partial [Billgrantia desiderata]